MAGYSKLFSSILTSSVWCEDNATRITWITLLALCDAKGVVEGSIPGLANQAQLSVEDTRQAVAKLMAPDPDSRTPEHEGRRIEAIRGGWRILNYLDYRSRLQEKEGSKAKAMRESRERKAAGATSGNALPNVTLPASAFEDASASAFEEGTCTSNRGFKVPEPGEAE